MAQAELQPGELRRFVHGRIRQPAKLARPPKPADLPERIPRTGATQRGTRLARLADVCPVGGRTRVEEAAEGRRNRVDVRVTHRRPRLVHDLQAVEEHAP